LQYGKLVNTISVHPSLAHLFERVISFVLVFLQGVSKLAPMQSKRFSVRAEVRVLLLPQRNLFEPIGTPPVVGSSCTVPPKLGCLRWVLYELKSSSIIACLLFYRQSYSRVLIREEFCGCTFG
jgi:hypothetical protein